VHGGFWLQSPTFGKVFDDLTVSGVEIDIVEWPGAPVGGRNGTGRSRIVVVVNRALPAAATSGRP